MINKQEFPLLKEVTDNISRRSKVQFEAIHAVYQYLIDLNSLYATLKIEKESATSLVENMETVDFYANFRDRLPKWQVSGPQWSLQGELHPAVEHASYWERKVTRRVWKFFRGLQWPDPESPKSAHECGIIHDELWGILAGVDLSEQ